MQRFNKFGSFNTNECLDACPKDKSTNLDVNFCSDDNCKDMPPLVSYNKECVQSCPSTLQFNTEMKQIFMYNYVEIMVI